MGFVWYKYVYVSYDQAIKSLYDVWCKPDPALLIHVATLFSDHSNPRVSTSIPFDE